MNSSPEDETDLPLWVYPKIDSDWNNLIVQEFRIHPVTAQIISARGFKELEDINQYLYAKLPDLHSPHLFPDMDKAVHRIGKAIVNSENILIYGDNDVDGMTGTTLLTELLETLGARTYYYIPNRSNLKQSLIIDALQYATKNDCKLLITVDCGITAAEGVRQVVQNNVDVIITDHHEPTDKIPHCVATLNPKLLNTPYPNKELTGVGVAFKLAHALINDLIGKGFAIAKEIDLKNYLDLVALGTISDMGALLGENRILVRYGLQQIQTAKRVGLAKLISISDLNPSNINVTHITSKIAPRLNSLGRIDDPRKGIALLLIKDSKKAEDLAKDLDLNNIERQKIERLASTDINDILTQSPDLLSEKAITLSSNDWHPGIIPIICTRLSKQYSRPVVIIAIDQGIGKGSIRSIPKFPLLNLLKENAHLLINFGGHDYAAGLSIKEENIEAFQREFVKYANSLLQDTDVRTKIYIDAKIDFNQINFDFMESLNLLEPFGNENPPPILFSDVNQAWPPKIIGNNHLKFYVEQNERMLEGIAFGMANKRKFIRKKGLPLRIAFTPQINFFQNKTSIQLFIRDFTVECPTF